MIRYFLSDETERESCAKKLFCKCRENYEDQKIMATVEKRGKLCENQRKEEAGKDDLSEIETALVKQVIFKLQQRSFYRSLCPLVCSKKAIA